MNVKAVLIKYTSFLLILIYIIFLFIDLNAKEINNQVALYLKYLTIVICFAITLFIGEEAVNTKDKRLVQGARFFTLIADFYLVILNNCELGIIAFCIVQSIYIIRHSIRCKVKMIRLLILIPIIFISVLIICGIKLQGLEKKLIILAVIYGLLLITSLYLALRTRSYLIGLGMFLFFMCDINVALYNIINRVPNSFLRGEFIIGFLIWLFYLPSQLLLTLSGFNRKFLKKVFQG